VSLRWLEVITLIDTRLLSERTNAGDYSLLTLSLPHFRLLTYSCLHGLATHDTPSAAAAAAARDAPI